jgi:hypothetical protein
MIKSRRVFFELMLAVSLFCGLDRIRGQTLEQPQSDHGLAPQWVSDWADPSAELRPLQIVHGIPSSQATPEAMATLKNLGLGGIVCNVSFDQYLTSETHWNTLVKAVQACKEVGLVVWIYDEDGYPSGAAGGLVIRHNPDFEAIALTYEPSRPEPFALRCSYEYTHASNNFYAARRYTNLIDHEAISCFIETTHEAYWRRLKDHFGKTIVAFFTDEPSLMGVNIGALPADIAKGVKVVDRLDPNVKPLPSVPWVRDLPDIYHQRYGQDIIKVRRSLFEGDTEADKQVRRQFWELISDRVAERYFGQIRKWTAAHGVASSGHSLWEETPLHQVPLEGNGLKALMWMDIPGLDMLSSDPSVVIYAGWLAANLPVSAALFNGGRKVMTEVSDFIQNMGGKGPASLADMKATAAWQAALGVTEFTLYYNQRQRTREDYRAYCDFVGRLNAILRKARPAPAVLLYYPIYDLWAEYKPVADTLTLQSQSKKAQQIVSSFLQLGQNMVCHQISFAVADHELLGGADVHDGKLWLNGQQFAALVLPSGVELPKMVAENLSRFEAEGGEVFKDSSSGSGVDLSKLSAAYQVGTLTVQNDRVVVGRFVRDGRNIVCAVNVGDKPYAGAVAANDGPKWVVADPASGQLEHARTEKDGAIAVSLPPRGTLLLVGPLTGSK